MKVVADENMPALSLWRDAGHQVTTLPGRTISNLNLLEADVLLVRSVTQVDKALVDGTPLCFVGTATSGFDHLDVDALNAAGIAFAYAPGSNAQSVVDYLFSTLAGLWADRGFNWLQATVGVIGCGQIGGQLLHQLEALGIRALGYDPFLPQGSFTAGQKASLEEVLACDVISVHTPLTHHGSHPTFHLLNKERLSGLREQQVLISAGRGAVVDCHALEQLLASGKGPSAVLDVWEGEPHYSGTLAELVTQATPHIAGYSIEGKVKGTQMLLDAFNKLVDTEPGSSGTGTGIIAPELLLPENKSLVALLSELVLQAYDVREDAKCFSACHQSSDSSVCFDRLRRDYPVRHEFSAFRVGGVAMRPELEQPLGALGFNV